MMNIIGNKESFAIQVEVTKAKPYRMGYFCIWIGGMHIGDLEEEVMLACEPGLLEGLIETLDRRERPDLFKMSENELFSLADAGEFNGSQYIFYLDESFDDFYVLAFVSGDEIHFIWKLDEERPFPPAGYPRGWFHKTVKMEHVKAVVYNSELYNLLTGEEL